mmetsp:Transcript_1156/g.3262  ORF Transcript_1156/g.3262 Transcript_1156/m.3262 type:complete len:248 (-) Transcript_1156:400-1143(-)
MKRSIPLVTALAVGALLGGTEVLAADANQPHYHTGVLPKFKAGPPSSFGFKLTGAQQRALDSGENVLATIANKDGDGSCIAVLDIPCPKRIIWERITDYKNYPRMVSGVTRCDTYKQQNTPQCKRNWSRYVVSAMGIKKEYFVEHAYEPFKSCMTFHLDYSRQSDFDDSVGYWYVCDHPNRKDTCRVFYSCRLKLRGWVPGPVKNYLMKTAVKQATLWVDKESKAQLAKEQSGGMRLGGFPKFGLAR